MVSHMRDTIKQIYNVSDVLKVFHDNPRHITVNHAVDIFVLTHLCFIKQAFIIGPNTFFNNYLRYLEFIIYSVDIFQVRLTIIGTFYLFHYTQFRTV